MGSDWHLRLAMGKSGAEMAGFLFVARQKRQVEGVATPKASQLLGSMVRGELGMLANSAAGEPRVLQFANLNLTAPCEFNTCSANSRAQPERNTH